MKAATAFLYRLIDAPCQVLLVAIVGSELFIHTQINIASVAQKTTNQTTGMFVVNMEVVSPATRLVGAADRAATSLGKKEIVVLFCR
jgi:hypothetical protein